MLAGCRALPGLIADMQRRQWIANRRPARHGRIGSSRRKYGSASFARNRQQPARGAWPAPCSNVRQGVAARPLMNPTRRRGRVVAVTHIARRPWTAASDGAGVRRLAWVRRLEQLVLFGFAVVELVAKSILDPSARVLSKPFHLRAIVDAVEKLLAARGRAGGDLQTRQPWACYRTLAGRVAQREVPR